MPSPAPEGCATGAPDRRCERRTLVELAVEVSGIDVVGKRFEQKAVARNVSLAGALLLGIKRAMRPGDLLRVHYGDNSAKFRVVWVSPIAAGATEIAVQRIETDPPIWPAGGQKAEAPAKPASLTTAAKS